MNVGLTLGESGSPLKERGGLGEDVAVLGERKAALGCSPQDTPDLSQLLRFLDLARR